VAIGECGLDYYRIPETLNREEVIENQKQQVRLQFDLADEMNLPVVIHCRDAHDDQFSIIQEYLNAGKLQRKGVIHCFTGTLKEAQRYIDVGFYISFTGILVFPDRKDPTKITDLQQIAKALPLKSILIETDAPYLTPPPNRGKRNEPWMVEFVAKTISELKSVPVEEVINQTNQNANNLFHLS